MFVLAWRCSLKVQHYIERLTLLLSVELKMSLNCSFLLFALFVATVVASISFHLYTSSTIYLLLPYNTGC